MGIISNGNTVIDNGAIDANEVDTTQIANDAVTADKLADTAVTAGAYTTADITVEYTEVEKDSAPKKDKKNKLN